MEIISIVVIIFALFALSRSILRVKDKAISISEFAFWSFIWILVVVIALLPGITDFFTRPLGIARGIDVAVYISIILLFYLLFRVYVKTEQARQDITKIVREMAKEKAAKMLFPKEKSKIKQNRISNKNSHQNN
jgi:hypothetical protein